MIARRRVGSRVGRKLAGGNEAGQWPVSVAIPWASSAEYPARLSFDLAPVFAGDTLRCRRTVTATDSSSVTHLVEVLNQEAVVVSGTERLRRWGLGRQSGASVR